MQNLLEERKEGHLPRPVVPLTTLVRRIAEALGLTPEEIRAPGRSRQVADARSVISYLAFRKMGYGGEAVAKELGISRSGVCRRASFGERLVLNDKRFQTVGTD